MPREKTKNFKRLCDDPHVRQLRRLPIGAEVVPARGVHFRVWASQRQRVEVVLEGGRG
jgi:1,4-alpha-glucan branching enzyme